ncbi:MAG: hypothetical protein U9R44_01500 [Candidatus Omnitrophota bacterium]|nr:hypothetical protein [Candidatus Omnitrophota bacterium]
MKKSNARMLRNMIIVLAVSCVALMGASPLFADIFGYEAEIKWGNTFFDIDSIMGSWFTCSESGTADSLTIGLHGWGTSKIKGAIYRKSDNFLVGETEEKNIFVGPAEWHTFNFLSSPQLSNEDYYLVMWYETMTLGFKGEDFSGKGAYHYVSYGSDWPNPWSPTTTGGFADVKYFIYCTYTPDGGGVPEIPAGAMPFLGVVLSLVIGRLRRFLK